MVLASPYNQTCQFSTLVAKSNVTLAQPYNQKCQFSTLVSKSNVTLEQPLRLKILQFFYIEIFFG